MDHDRLFKELLTTFFVEFVDLFLPALSAALDKNSAIVPMDKELFTDVTAGDKHEVDVLMQARFRGEDAFFLVHIENQASPQTDFPKRMFRYFARLTEKYDLPVYPVVLFSYDAPRRPEPNQFTVAFSGETVLQFRYQVIQLNRLPWRRFVLQPNPVAAALIAKMKMTARDRPKVKVECLRLLASLRLDPARATLIGGFIDSYLQMTGQELKQYEREMAKLLPPEREQTMEMMTSWHREGIAQGKEAVILRQLRRRLGDVTAGQAARVDRLSSDQFDALADALLDFERPADLERWLAQQPLDSPAQR